MDFSGGLSYKVKWKKETFHLWDHLVLVSVYHFIENKQITFSEFVISKHDSITTSKENYGLREPKWLLALF